MIRALAVFVGIAACQSPPNTDEHTAAIVGGTLDSADDAVVALTVRTRPCGEAPQAACTGALIGSRAVLTAAHCVTGESPATLVVTIGPRVDGGERVEESMRSRSTGLRRRRCRPRGPVACGATRRAAVIRASRADRCGRGRERGPRRRLRSRRGRAR